MTEPSQECRDCEDGEVRYGRHGEKKETCPQCSTISEATKLANQNDWAADPRCWISIEDHARRLDELYADKESQRSAAAKNLEAAANLAIEVDELKKERDEARQLLGEVSTLLRGDARVADELEIERRIEVFLFPPCKNASCKDGKIPPHTLREVNMGIENLCPDCNPLQDRRRR